MLKLLHAHDDGKLCYQIDAKYSQFGIYKFRGAANKFLVAYMQYTNQWYAFDLVSGQEIATFTKEFYESNIKQFKILDVEPDDNCLKQQP